MTSFRSLGAYESFLRIFQLHSFSSRRQQEKAGFRSLWHQCQKPLVMHAVQSMVDTGEAVCPRQAGRGDCLKATKPVVVAVQIVGHRRRMHPLIIPGMQIFKISSGQTCTVWAPGKLSRLTLRSNLQHDCAPLPFPQEGILRGLWLAWTSRLWRAIALVHSSTCCSEVSASLCFWRLGVDSPWTFAS